MFPIKKITMFNLVTNLSIIVMTLIDYRAGLITVALLFMFEHGDDVVKRGKQTKDVGHENSA